MNKSQHEIGSDMWCIERRGQLLDMYRETGLQDLMQLMEEPKCMEQSGTHFVKMRARAQRIFAIEIWEPHQEQPYVRIHFRPPVSPILVEKIRTLGQVRSSDEYGVDLFGDHIQIAKGLRVALMP